MTNLVAIIGFTITTNWVTYSIERAVCPVVGCAALHLDTHHQRGTIESNKVATVTYKGKPFSVILESTEIGNISRSVIAK